MARGTTQPAVEDVSATRKPRKALTVGAAQGADRVLTVEGYPDWFVRGIPSRCAHARLWCDACPTGHNLLRGDLVCSIYFAALEP